MIVARDGEALRVVTQHDHARLAEEILALWRADALPGHPRRAEILFAVREHDNGWREADSAPRADPETGRPRDFSSMPRDVRFEIWLRGAARHARERPWTALLIAHHALALHRDRRGDETWDESFFEPLDERYAELMDRLEEGTEAAVEADYRYLDVADALSLVACGRWDGPGRLRGYRWSRRDGGPGVDDTLELDPFPLAGATTFQVACRRIPDRSYRGDADLGAELAGVRWSRFRVRLTPASGAAGPTPERTT